jgi:hypothetical protein
VALRRIKRDFRLRQSSTRTKKTEAKSTPLSRNLAARRPSPRRSTVGEPVDVFCLPSNVRCASCT